MKFILFSIFLYLPARENVGFFFFFVVDKLKVGEGEFKPAIFVRNGRSVNQLSYKLLKIKRSTIFTIFLQ